LHGILGTVEILQEEISDPELASMVNAIDVSGRTLSDIVESLLGYSKINSTAQLKSRSRTSILAGKDKSGIQLDADVELGKLTEEVSSTILRMFQLHRTHIVRSLRAQYTRTRSARKQRFIASLPYLILTDQSAYPGGAESL